MGSGLSPSQKVAYVVGTLLPMLLNDMRTIIECRCEEHGRPAGSAPNFSAVLASLIACEVVGCLCASGGGSCSVHTMTRAFLWRVGKTVSDSSYTDAAGPLIVFFRHGIAHTFLPKSYHGVVGSVEWYSAEKGGSICVDRLTADLALQDSLRQNHLSVGPVSGMTVFKVLPQILYLDVARTLREYEQLLRANDATEVRLLAQNFETWFEDNTKIQTQLTPAEKQYMGLS